MKLLVGEENGRRIIADPLSGTVLVHAMPRELLDIQQYLDDLQVSVNRQVIIEAKIVSKSALTTSFRRASTGLR